MQEAAYTTDSIWNERVRIVQPRSGYRFALDSVLLAHFLKTEPEEEGLEIGCGTGVIAVLLSRLRKFQRILAVEIQPELAELARKNFELNGISNVEVLEADVKDLKQMLPAGLFDFIFSNPPYRKLGAGKLNPSIQKAIARHEIRMELEDLFVCAEHLLKPHGRLSVILPAFREKDFDRFIKLYRFSPREHRYVHSLRSEPPNFFLATLSRRESPFVRHSPLVIYDSPGCYTGEMNRLLTKL